MMTETTATTRTAPAEAAPPRRVGSLTLGACLILAGVFFLLYYFWPAFDWMLALKLAPAAGLIALGGEVLYCAARPGRRRQDFWSVLACLLLIGMGFALSLLPVLADELGRQQAQELLREQYEAEAYAQFSREEPQLRLRDVGAYISLYSGGAAEPTLASLAAGSAASDVYLRAELWGGYEDAAAFAEDCRALADAAAGLDLPPDTLTFVSEDEFQRWTLELRGPVQLGWTAAEMAAEASHEVYDQAENALYEVTVVGEPSGQ